MPQKAFDIKVYGLVQGVGFRPFAYGLASDLKLEGWALNRNECVEIRVQGDARRQADNSSTHSAPSIVGIAGLSSFWPALSQRPASLWALAFLQSLLTQVKHWRNSISRSR